TGEADAVATTLHRQLLAPFGDQLAGVQRLFVAPDGVLHLLAFGLLRDASGRRVMEGLDVRQVQSGRDLLRPDPDKPARGLVAVGGIDFGALPAGQKTAALASPFVDESKLAQ